MDRATSSGSTTIRRLHSPMDPNSQTEVSTPSIMNPATQRPLPRLPIEVWERAIGWLVANAVGAEGTGLSEMSIRRDLSACALVCRAWRPRAQFHLFMYPRITGDGLSVYEKLISRSPVLCRFAKELSFYNQYVDEEEMDKTIETASHAARIAHKLSNMRRLMMDNINLAVENPNLPRHFASLRNLNCLEFLSFTPTKLSQLARMLVGLKNLSTLFLDVPISVDSSPLPTSCYATKSSLTGLTLIIQLGGNLLVGWLVNTISFTTSLKHLCVGLEDEIP